MRLGTSRKIYIYIAIAWFLGFLRELPVLVGIRHASDNITVGSSCYYWPDQSANIFIFAVLFISQYLAPAVIFLVNFYRIKKRLTRLGGTLNVALADERERVKIMRRKKRTIRIMFMVLIIFLLFWTPNNVMYLLFQYAGDSNVTWNSNYYQFGIILGFSSSCVNPFLYAFQSKQFRVHCGKFLRKLLKARRKSRSMDASQSFTSSTVSGLRGRFHSSKL